MKAKKEEIMEFFSDFNRGEMLDFMSQLAS